MNAIDCSLYLVTNSDPFPEERFLKIIEEALQNGVTLLQLREKELTGRAYYERALAVKKLARQYHVPLIIDDRIDIALAADADGVHLGQSDLPVSVARRLMGPDKIVGASAKTVEQALEAERQGADYLGTGAIFPTRTKVITQQTSTDTLRAICEAVRIPVAAIGGLNRENVHVLDGIPVSGFCVVSAIMYSETPGAAAKKLATISANIQAMSQNL